MKLRKTKAIGYGMVFLPFAMFWLGVAIGAPWLAVAFFFLIVPMLRPIFGDMKATRRIRYFTPRVQSILNAIPRVYAVLWVATLLGAGFWLMKNSHDTSALIGFGFSLWVVTSVNMCVAHELIHGDLQSNRLNVWLGRMLSATSGHPYFPYEHKAHHAYPFDDCAEPGTSLYVFAVKRVFSSFGVAYRWEKDRLARRHLSNWHNGLLHWSLVTLCIFGTTYLFGGLSGLYLAVAVSIGSIFTEQTITFLQHWGLKETGGAWEDGCFIQSSILLNHPYHTAHHRRASLPYYYLTMEKHSYRLPTSYAVMFMIALVPPLFDTLMRDALARQIGNPASLDQEESRTCIALAGR